MQNPNFTRKFQTPATLRANFDQTASEEPWTQYDGLGPIPQSGRRGGQGNWRSGGGGGGGNQQYGGHPNRQRQQKQRGNGMDARRMPQSTAGQKRKPSPNNRESFDNREVIDDQFLDRTFAPIKKADYPGAPKALFDNPKAFLWDSKILKPQSTFAAHHNGWFRCTILVRVAGMEPVVAVGEAQNKKVAERIAAKHVVLLLHQTGMLRELLTGGAHAKAHDRNLLNEEQEAKVDIYDYCARSGEVPTFIIRQVPGVIRGKGLIEATVELPSQQIRASARAVDRTTAEILACVEFKYQAEKWHAKFGDEDIVVKDISSSLNSRNAKKFFDYYKYFVDKRVIVEVDCRSPHGHGRITGNNTKAQVIMNGEPIGEPVEMVKKKQAETAAYLTGAVALKNRYPQLFHDFIEALRLGNGDILKPINPEWLDLKPDCIDAMHDTLDNIRQLGIPLTEEEIKAEVKAEQNAQRRQHSNRFLDPALAAVKSKKMLEAYEQYLNDPALETLRTKRSELPMVQYTDQVLGLVDNNDFSIIVGATGSGKTTQVPQILLESATKAGHGADCNIICTQPRRIAATSVAQRVAVERNEPLKKAVGYQVRFDASLPLPGGSITYCTTGILLQQLRNNPDQALAGITHLVIDEVHERDIMIDYLLIIMKRVMKIRKAQGKPSVKVVLMSATMDTELFANYFRHRDEEGNIIECPHLSVPGRTFPVKEVYLEDIQEMLESNYPSNQLNLLRMDPDSKNFLEVEKNFVASWKPAAPVLLQGETRDGAEAEDTTDAAINWKQEVTVTASGEAVITSEKEDALVPIGLGALTMAHIAKTTTDGAVLCFLPGLEEITNMDKTLRSKPLGVDFQDTTKFRMYMLHSSIPNQNEVFDEVPPGVRKIILSTNIAETSITIPDVKYVVDTGKLREKQYEQSRRITSLICTWVSKSNSKQRAGRAGRVQNGNYFALFSKKRYDSMRATGLPEMLRSDLQEICLDIKLQGFEDSIAQFLSEAIEAPSPHAIEASLRQLRALGALDEEEGLTPLGRALATMPVEPALGKMIILAVIFRCVDPIIILGAAAGGREIFVSPLERRQEANRARASFVRNTGSDHMATITAYKEWRTIRDRDGQYAAHRFAEENFLHRGGLKVLDQTAKQIEDILGEIGIIRRVPGSRFKQGGEFGHPELNENSNSTSLIKALILAGMYPNIAVCSGGKGYRTVSEAFTMIHPSSCHYDGGRGGDGPPLGQIMTYSTKAKSNDGRQVNLRQNTVSSSLVALLFGGKLRARDNTLEIDNWLPFLARASTARVVLDFKKVLDGILANAFRSLYKRNEDVEKTQADETVRKTFAHGLVDVLDGDQGRQSKFPSRNASPPRFGGGGYRNGAGPGNFARPNDFPPLQFGQQQGMSGRSTPSSGFRGPDRFAPQGPQSGRSTPVGFVDRGRPTPPAMPQSQQQQNNGPPTGPAGFNQFPARFSNQQQQPPTGPRSYSGRNTPAGPWGGEKWR